MGSVERSKKKIQLWKKAIVHFSLCFVMGFFSGFAPTGKGSIFSSHNLVAKENNKSEIIISPRSVHSSSNVNRSLGAETPAPAKSEELLEIPKPKSVDFNENVKFPHARLLIIVTPITSTRDDQMFQVVLLRRLANTIRLVPQPLLWIVVEGQSDSNEVSEMLRKTGVMYRHLVFKENFTEPEAELNHQRNVALKHIEHHKLSGIVHFAGLSNVYDLDFFNELRQIEVFGTWPMALLSANKRKVVIEGPICDSSQVIGWHLRKMNNRSTDSETADVAEPKPPPIHISSFAFNSSILWDPERWGRPTSVQGTSQNSLKFVKQVVLEDETKLKGIPPEECSKIMLWHLHFPIGVVPKDLVKTTPLLDVNTHQR